MNQSDAIDIANRFTPKVSPLGRRSYDPARSYKQCIDELRFIVASCPLVVNYMAYLTIKKAVAYYKSIGSQATVVIRTITDVERGMASQEDLDLQINALKSLTDAQLSIVASANAMYRDRNGWLSSMSFKLSSREAANYTTSDEAEVLALAKATVPTSITGLSYSLNSSLSIRVSEGSAVLLHSTGKYLETRLLVPVGSSILGSLVKSSSTTATTESPVTGVTTTVIGSVVSCPVPVLRYNGTTRDLVESILNSQIQVSTDSEKVSTCLRAMRLPYTPRPEVVVPNIVFSNSVKKCYSKIESVCNKWRQPEILSYILKTGPADALSSTARPSSYEKLKGVNKDIAELTNTRGTLR